MYITEFDIFEGETSGDDIKNRKTIYTRKAKVNDNE